LQTPMDSAEALNQLNHFCENFLSQYEECQLD
jgi:hypothetical protein